MFRRDEYQSRKSTSFWVPTDAFFLMDGTQKMPLLLDLTGCIGIPMERDALVGNLGPSQKRFKGNYQQLEMHLEAYWYPFNWTDWWGWDDYFFHTDNMTCWTILLWNKWNDFQTGGFCFLCVTVGPTWSCHKENAKIQKIQKEMSTIKLYIYTVALIFF